VRDAQASALASYVASVDPTSLAFFVGSGISTFSGLPGAAELVQLTAGVLLAHAATPLHNPRRDEAAALFKACYPEAFFQVLTELLGEEARAPITMLADISATPNAAHALFAWLLVERRATVITTNWDTLIEDALEEDVARVWRPAGEGAFEHYRAGSPCLIKLHGSLHDPSSVSATLRATAGIVPESLRDVMHTALEDKVCIFIGYSGRDLDLGPLLRQVRFRKTHAITRSATSRIPLPGAHRWDTDIKRFVPALAARLGRPVLELTRAAPRPEYAAGLQPWAARQSTWRCLCALGLAAQHMGRVTLADELIRSSITQTEHLEPRGRYLTILHHLGRYQDMARAGADLEARAARVGDPVTRAHAAYVRVEAIRMQGATRGIAGIVSLLLVPRMLCATRHARAVAAPISTAADQQRIASEIDRLWFSVKLRGFEALDRGPLHQVLAVTGVRTGLQREARHAVDRARQRGDAVEAEHWRRYLARVDTQESSSDASVAYDVIGFAQGENLFALDRLRAGPADREAAVAARIVARDAERQPDANTASKAWFFYADVQRGLGEPALAIVARRRGRRLLSRVEGPGHRLAALEQLIRGWSDEHAMRRLRRTRS